MNINYFRDRATGGGNFCCVGVADLVAANIGGGAVTVFAEATVSGDSASALSIASTSSTSVPLGNSIVHGWGVAIAIGANPAVNVDIFGGGDRPIDLSQSHFFRTRYRHYRSS